MNDRDDEDALLLTLALAAPRPRWALASTTTATNMTPAIRYTYLLLIVLSTFFLSCLTRRCLFQVRVQFVVIFLNAYGYNSIGNTSGQSIRDAHY